MSDSALRTPHLEPAPTPEAPDKRGLPAPGVDASICAVCGGSMSPPHRGRVTRQYMRTCSSCFRTVASEPSVDEVHAARPITTHAGEVVRLPLEWLKRPEKRGARKRRPKVEPLDARQRQTGERD